MFPRITPVYTPMTTTTTIIENDEASSASSTPPPTSLTMSSSSSSTHPLQPISPLSTSSSSSSSSITPSTTGVTTSSTSSVSSTPILSGKQGSGLTIIRSNNNTLNNNNNNNNITNNIITSGYDYEDDTNTSNTSSRSTTPTATLTLSENDLHIDWNLMQSILSGISTKISQNTSSPGLRFAESTNEYFQQLHQQRPLIDLLTVLDQLIEVTAAQPRPLTPEALDALTRSLEPLQCSVSTSDLLQTILLKIWPPEYNYMLHMADNNDNGMPFNTENMYFNNVDTNGFIRVFNLNAAKTTIATVDTNLFNNELCQNETLVKFLCDLYATDPLGFWSVFDQLCSRCLCACQRGIVRQDSISTTFLACCAGPALTPIDTTLSPIVAASMPSHPLLPYGYPPHYLRKSAFVSYMQSTAKSGFIPSSSSSSSAASVSVVNSNIGGNVVSVSGIGGMSASPSPGLMGSSASGSCAASPGVDVGSHSRSPSPAGSAVLLNGGNDIITFGNGGNDSGNGKTYLSDPERFKRLRKEECSDIDAFYPYTWRAALLIFDEIEKKLNGSNKKCICFDEKHKQNLRKKWEENPKGFFSIIDQIFEKLIQTNWNAVRDEARYVQSLIAKFVPQTVVSRLIQSYITPPEVAAAMMEA